MRRLPALFALFCSISAAETVSAGTVSVLLKSDGISAPILRAMEQETDFALAPSGLKVIWLSDVPGAGVSGEMAVLRLRGRCGLGAPARSTDPVMTANGQPVLGQTHIVDGRVLPIADILCESVRKLVDRDLKAADSRDREPLMGRALGRVAAHELYHILAHTTDHARTGLSRPEQSSSELLAPHESFTAQDERRISDSVDSDSADTARGR